MNAVLKEQSFIIHVERYSDELAKELMPLLEKNWKESASYKPEIELKPDFARYKKMDELGMLQILTARRPPSATDAGRVVGYAIWFIVTSFNYEGLKVAHGTAWYMEPSVRGHGLDLLRTGQVRLAQRGIKRFYWFVPAKDNRLKDILLLLGYKPDELIMEMIL